MKPEEELLVAICKQAADDYLTAYDELGIAKLRGEQSTKNVNMWRNLFDDARNFFLDGSCRDLVNANDKEILRGLEADTKIPRNWNRFNSWNEVMSAWNECDYPRSSDHKTEMKQLHAWLIRKCEGETK